MTPEQVVLADELATLRRVARAAERFCRKRAWRRAVLLRTTRTALVLRAIERALGDNYVRRVKGDDRRWTVFGRSDKGEEVLVALVGGGSTRRLDDVRAPVPVEILEPSYINLDALRHAVSADIPNVQEKM